MLGARGHPRRRRWRGDLSRIRSVTLHYGTDPRGRWRVGNALMGESTMSELSPIGSTRSNSIPVFDEDVYSDEALYNPFPLLARLREVGPVVRSTKYNFLFVGRYDDVVAGLAEHDRFISGRGTGLSDFLTEQPWRKPSMLLETDPPDHTR